MITKTFKTTDGKIKITIPSELKEITLGMMIGLDKKNADNTDLSELEVISVLSGIQKDELYNVRNIDDFNEFQNHVLSLVHQIQYTFQEQAVIPKEVTISGKTVNVINNLSVEPVGAFMNCRDIIADEINEAMAFFGEEEWKQNNNFKPSLKCAARVLAHYFYCPVTKKPYNEFEAEAFEAEVTKLPMVQALPIATFFFLNYPNLLKPKVSFLNLFKAEWKKRQALRHLKYTGITTR